MSWLRYHQAILVILPLCAANVVHGEFTISNGEFVRFSGPSYRIPTTLVRQQPMYGLPAAGPSAAMMAARDVAPISAAELGSLAVTSAELAQNATNLSIADREWTASNEYVESLPDNDPRKAELQQQLQHDRKVLDEEMERQIAREAATDFARSQMENQITARTADTLSSDIGGGVSELGSEGASSFSGTSAVESGSSLASGNTVVGGVAESVSGVDASASVVSSTSELAGSGQPGGAIMGGGGGSAGSVGGGESGAGAAILGLAAVGGAVAAIAASSGGDDNFIPQVLRPQLPETSVDVTPNRSMDNDSDDLLVAFMQIEMGREKKAQSATTVLPKIVAQTQPLKSPPSLPIIKEGTTLASMSPVLENIMNPSKSLARAITKKAFSRMRTTKELRAETLLSHFSRKNVVSSRSITAQRVNCEARGFSPLSMGSSRVHRFRILTD